MSRTKKALSDRDQHILDLYAEGVPGTRLADRFSITRQRVDQILKKYGGVDATQAREVRAGKRAADFKLAVNGFLYEYETTIHALSDSGATRAEIEQKFALLVPETPLEVIRAGISATGALFDVAREDFHFSPLVVEASVWYVLGRLHGLSGDVDTALSELAADEMVAVADALAADGVAPEAIRSVLFVVAAARRLIIDDPELTLTKKQYDAERTAAVGDLGLQSTKGVFAWPPTSQTIMKRLGQGYWSDALKAINITPSDRGRTRGLLLFEESDYKNAVTDFLSHCQATGIPRSYDAFDNWVRNEERAGRRRPSAPAIRKFYGSWIAAKRQALTGEGAAPPKPPVTTVAASIARTGLHDASIARREAIDRLSSTPALEVPNVLSSFIRDYMGEFEVRRREWVRAMILRDPNAVERRKAKDGLPKQQREVIAQTPTDVAAVLTDRYLDGMLSAEDGLKNVDGWLDDETQQQIEAISESDMAAARVMRELRNYFTHDSAEARHRLGESLAKLATFDHRFQIEQALTRRVVTGLLLANNAARLKELSGSVLAAWRVMLAAEAVQLEPDSA